MNKVLPSILGVRDVASFLDILTDLRNKEVSNINAIHVDIMDGKFVENECLDIKNIKTIKEKGYISDVHLMVENPENLIKESAELGADNITIHYEIDSFYDTLKLLKKYREINNINIGVSICPETTVDALIPIINDIDSVLLMSVHPGKGGQAFIEDSYNKIVSLRKLSSRIRIVVDGGVNNINIENIISSGADNVVIGSYLTKDLSKIEENIKNLN